MTSPDLPYTDADLRAEAAHQLHNAAVDHDFMGIGEQLQGRYVRYEVVDPAHGDLMPPPGTPQWDDLPEDQFEVAREGIDTLLTNAADLSEWAINLGADGLEPSPDQVTVSGDDRPVVRVHLAFDPGMPTEARAALVAGLGQALADLL